MEKIYGKVTSGIKNLKVPHVFVLLTILLFVATAMTYVVPSGKYDMIVHATTGRKVIDPASFKYIAQIPQSFLDIPKFIVNSLVSSSSIIFMVMISAASVEVVIATGTFDVSLKKLIKKFQGKEQLLIILTLVIFAVMGLRQNSMSMVGFVPLVVLLSRMAGYDALVGVAIILLGAGGSYSIGPLATSTTAIAQGFADLPTFSGFGYRMFCVAVLLTVSAFYILRYAKMVKKDPSKSYVYDLEQKEKGNYDFKNILETEEKLTARHMGVLAVFIGNFFILAYGGMVLNWGNNQVAAQFLLLAAVAGLVGGLTPSQISQTFGKGAAKMTVAGLMIGFASAISKILAAGAVIDTVVSFIAGGISFFPGFIQPVIMFVVNCIANFFITSGSGQAAAVMPLFIPVSDLVGMTRQTTVLAFNYGDGLSNFLIPTSSALMGNIMAAGISYDKWMKFMIKVFVGWSIASSITLIIAHVIKLGPF